MASPTAPQGCTFYSSFTPDTSLCNRLGTETSFMEWLGASIAQSKPDESSVLVTSSKSYITFYSRYFGLTTYDATTVLTSKTATEFDRCLPGPTTCNFGYSNGPCPTGYDSLRRDFVSSTTTDYCCPRIPLLSASFREYDYSEMSYNPHTPETGEPTSLPVFLGNRPLLACIYSWENTPDSLFPTATLPVSVTAPTAPSFMTIKALRAMYTTITAPAPRSTSSLPSSTTTSTPSSSSSSTTLTTAAKAGIGVGAILGSILLITLLLLLHRNRRQRKLLSDMEISDSSGKPELSGDTVQKKDTTGELSGHREVGEFAVVGQAVTAEMAGDDVLHELPDTNQPVEIGGEKGTRQPAEIGVETGR